MEQKLVTMTDKNEKLPLFEEFQLSKKISKDNLFEGIVVVGDTDTTPDPEISELDDALVNDNASQGTKDYAREMMAHLHNHDVGVYSNRMYSEKDGTAHIPIKHADSYDQDVVDELNKKGQKIRKMLSKAGFEEFETKFETDKVIGGSTVFLTINPR